METEPTFKSVTHALFQARMWREYTRTFDGIPTHMGIDQRWCETVGKWTRDYCIKRAWIAARAAQRMNDEAVRPEPDDICGFCELPGADKIPHPIRWPGEESAGTTFVHAACEQAECERAHAALTDEQRREFLKGC